MKKCVIRPMGGAQILLVFFAVFFIFAGFGSGYYLLSEKHDLVMALIFCLTADVLSAGFLYGAFRQGTILNKDHMAIVRWKNPGQQTSLFPKVARDIVAYSEISIYGCFLLGDLAEILEKKGAIMPYGIANLRDVLLMEETDGTLRIFDLENYSDAQKEHLMFELEARTGRHTGIWPDGRVLPKAHRGYSWLPIVRAFWNLLGCILIFIVLPVLMIWVEGWINPNHPPGFNSGWRTGYVLSAMFASFAVMGYVAAKRRDKAQAGDESGRRRVQDAFYKKMAKIFGIITLILYGIFALTFVISFLL